MLTLILFLFLPVSAGKNNYVAAGRTAADSAAVTAPILYPCPALVVTLPDISPAAVIHEYPVSDTLYLCLC